jgi:hypothetical protein
MLSPNKRLSSPAKAGDPVFETAMVGKFIILIVEEDWMPRLRGA